LNGYCLRRKNYIGNTWVRFGGPFRNYPDCALRLFKKDWGSVRDGIVDEKIMVDGITGTLHGFLDHYMAADLEEFTRKMNYKAGLKALEFFRKGRGKNAFVRKIAGTVKPAMAFIGQILFRGAFLQGGFGFRTARMHSGYTEETWRRLGSLYRKFGLARIPREIEQSILTPGLPWPAK
jgi:hypothetical protein